MRETRDDGRERGKGGGVVCFPHFGCFQCVLTENTQNNIFVVLVSITNFQKYVFKNNKINAFSIF